MTSKFKNVISGIVKKTEKFQALSILALALVCVITLSSCGSSEEAKEEASDSETKEVTEVNFQLEWTPNTNHMGLYVAQDKGFFEEESLKVNILPYGSAFPANLVSEGKADFGVGGQAWDMCARASGLDVKTVYVITQDDTGRVATLTSREDITRPRDLDGKIFGGFGIPLFTEMAKQTIIGDGGKGDMQEVILSTAAYEALNNGDVDFSLSIETWESIERELAGEPYKTWRYQDFGVPMQHSTTIISSDKFLEENPEVAKRFIKAIRKGYQYCIDNPQESAEILIKMVPELEANKELVLNSAELMATDNYFASKERPIGEMNPQFWTDYGKFLMETGILIDKDGNKITEAPNWEEYYTSELLK